MLGVVYWDWRNGSVDWRGEKATPLRNWSDAGGNWVANGGIGDEEMEILRDLGAGRMRSRNETEERRRIMKRKRIIMKLMTIIWRARRRCKKSMKTKGLYMKRRERR